MQAYDTVGDVMTTGNIYTCSPEDTVDSGEGFGASKGSIGLVSSQSSVAAGGLDHLKQLKRSGSGFGPCPSMLQGDWPRLHHN